MTNDKQRERLVELIQASVNGCARNWAEVIADYLLANGIIIPPVKVGDKVYKVWYGKCHNGETVPDSWSCSGCYDVCDIKKEITEVVVPNLKFIVETFMSGYTNDVYFLSREEAEAKLKGGVQ